MLPVFRTASAPSTLDALSGSPNQYHSINPLICAAELRLRIRVSEGVPSRVAGALSSPPPPALHMLTNFIKIFI